MLTSLNSGKSTCPTKMGAIDPFVAKNHVKLKSASIEATSNPPIGRSTTCNLKYDCGDTISSIDISTVADQKSEYSPNSPQQPNKSKKFFTLSTGSLKPSVSTSCLLTTADTKTSSTLVCIPTRASLTHEWKKLKTPNKCRECNVLVYFNGRECSFCGFVAHKKCVAVLVIKCSGQQVAEAAARNYQLEQSKQISSNQSPDNQLSNRTSKQTRPPIQPIFGQPINADSFQVVDFIRRFIYEIDTRGLTSRGIYRVSSIKSKVDRLCNYYNQNLSSLIDLSSFHPNIIANALKMYLRQLPEPLLTNVLYSEFIRVAKKYTHNTSTSSSSLAKSAHNNQTQQIKPLTSYRHRKPYSLPVLSVTTAVTNNPSYNPLLIVELREVIELMPPINRRLVAIIMHHLKRVADMSDENQMSAKNLSIIFGPTLLSSNNKSLAIVDNVHQARVVELMILWADQIFPQYENYESKAVIDLDFSDEEYWQQRMQQEREASDNQEKSIGKTKQQKPTDHKLAPNSKVDTNDQSRLTKTRSGLRELRRQFFTSPARTTTRELTFYPETAKFTDPKRSYNPPGSVPVIKVQPCYCNNLTHYSRSKS